MGRSDEQEASGTGVTKRLALHRRPLVPSSSRCAPLLLPHHHGALSQQPTAPSVAPAETRTLDLLVHCSLSDSTNPLPPDLSLPIVALRLICLDLNGGVWAALSPLVR
jgi:hypothetical protein